MNIVIIPLFLEILRHVQYSRINYLLPPFLANEHDLISSFHTL